MGGRSCRAACRPTPAHVAHLDRNYGLLKQRRKIFDAEGLERFTHCRCDRDEQPARLAHERRAQLGALRNERLPQLLQVRCERAELACTAKYQPV